MPDLTRLLVVANRTAESDELLGAIKRRLAAGPLAVTLLVPATWEVGDPHGGKESAQRHMRAAAARLRDEGIDVECVLGDPDPAAAVAAAWDPERYDAVIVSTLPSRVSKWLKLDLPRRVEHLTGGPVEHVVAQSATSASRRSK
jgi:GABA permease